MLIVNPDLTLALVTGPVMVLAPSPVMDATESAEA